MRIRKTLCAAVVFIAVPLSAFAASGGPAQTALENLVPYETGFEEMRSWIYRKPQESLRWYFDGAHGGWLPPRELGITGSSEDEDAYERPIIARILAERPARALRAHTHSLAALERSRAIAPDYAARLKRFEVSLPLAPPSLKDLLFHIWYAKRHFSGTGTEFVDIVFAPRGTWQIATHDGESVKAIYAFQRMVRETIPERLHALGYRGEEAIALAKAIYDFDADFLERIGNEQVNALAIMYANARRDFYPYERLLQAYVRASQVASIRSLHASEDQKKLIGELCSIARAFDIELSFEPYTTPYVE